jgi:hypothetical protein
MSRVTKWPIFFWTGLCGTLTILNTASDA